MLLFLILLLPCAFTAYTFTVKDKKIILPATAGFFTAVIACACRYFFSYEHRLIYSSFSDNFIYYLVKQNVLPLVIVTVLFALITRDTWEYKVKNFFALMCPFFSVYLPYCVITASEYYYQAYDLFLKPFIYLAMIVQVSFSLICLYESIVNKKIPFAVLHSLIILLYLIYPAISDALYAINYNFAVILSVGIVYILVPTALLVIRQLKK
ncbi:MAG: hypothetical protein J5687_06600 [Treponema sp.]|nr:hypothetical protein [Treponema sp.]